MFNIPYVYRDGYNGGDPLPVFGSAKAILWVDSLKEVYNGLPYTAATNGNTDIRLWKDQTIYANHLTATTTNSPTYSASTFAPSGTSSPFPYIRFNDGNSEYMSAKLSTSLSNISTGFTLFFVFKRNTSANWSNGDPIIFFSDQWTGSGNGFGVEAYGQPPSYMRFWFKNTAFNIVPVDVLWGSGGIDEDSFFYYTFRMSAGTINGYVGNVLKQTFVGDPSKTMLPVPPTGKFYVAAGFDGTVFKQATPIDVAEVLLYDGAIPNSGLPTVWNYFKQKYGFIN